MNVSTAANENRETPLRKQRGFTLLELVTVLVLLGIVAVFAAQRFTGTGSFAEHGVREQLIAASRYAQQRAMADRSPAHCYRMRVQSDRYGPQRSTDSGASFDWFGPGEWATGIEVDPQVVIAPATSVVFNGLGNAVADCSAGAGSVSPTLNVSGEISLALCIESSGYAHAC